jgi:molecular chaperone DnaK
MEPVPPPSDIILGIDLGTSNSTAAAFIDGKFHFALDSRGESCVPSIVHFPAKGLPIVGAEADRYRVTDAPNTVAGIKRIIGRALDSPQGRLVDAGSAFKLKGGSVGEVKIVTRTGEVGASEIAAIIMGHLRERAELRFGRKITKAVVTVPVGVPKAVTEAMMRVGRMARLEILRIVPEPVAGALAGGVAGPSMAGTPVLVYDFGGGTLDISIVQRSGQQLKVLASGGDDCLGGDDFDSAFAKWIASGVWRSLSVDVSKDVILSDRIQRQCEVVKRALSAAPEVRYLVPDAIGSPGRFRSLDVMVKREQLNGPWAELVQRSIDATTATLEPAGITVPQLGAILLIGGTTFIPQVRAAVAAHFPRPFAVEQDPQTAVARGAALLAAQPNLLA